MATKKKATKVPAKQWVVINEDNNEIEIFNELIDAETYIMSYLEDSRDLETTSEEELQEYVNESIKMYELGAEIKLNVTKEITLEVNKV
jgi:uncharacterized protein (DUF2235 family)